MIRWHVHGHPSPKISRANLVLLCHESTLFGLHQRGVRPYLEWDNECTKTTLVAFLEDDHARIFSTFVTKNRDMIARENEDLSHRQDCVAFDTKKDILRLALRGDVIEGLCRFHAFHLFTVYDLHIAQESDAIDIDVYETTVPDTPDVPRFQKWLQQIWELP